MLYEQTRDSRSQVASFGVATNQLKPIPPITKELIDHLRKYNEAIYKPAKHDFKVPLGRSHRFTASEVVLAAFVTVELGNRIKAMSKVALEESAK